MDSDKGGRDQWIAWLTEVMSECLRVLEASAETARQRIVLYAAEAAEKPAPKATKKVESAAEKAMPKTLMDLLGGGE